MKLDKTYEEKVYAGVLGKLIGVYFFFIVTMLKYGFLDDLVIENTMSNFFYIFVIFRY